MTLYGRISRIRVVSQVYESLRRAILSGELKAGTHLQEVTISQEMGVSRAPVREALLQLEAEGLVELRPNRGAFVSTLTEKDVREIYETRRMLEGRLAALAAQKAIPEDIEHLYQLCQVALDVSKEGDIFATINADFDIHRSIWQLSDHRLMQDILSNIESRIKLFLALQAPLFESLIESVIDHTEIVAAIEHGDPEIACQTMEENIDRAGTLVLKEMQAQSVTRLDKDGDEFPLN